MTSPGLPDTGNKPCRLDYHTDFNLLMASRHGVYRTYSTSFPSRTAMKRWVRQHHPRVILGITYPPGPRPEPLEGRV
jgi:hypothetical protein